MSSKPPLEDIASTVPSTNEDEDEHDIRNSQQPPLALPSVPSEVSLERYQQLQQPSSSTFSSPRLNNPSGTPVLSGENIVLLSFSNETTPADTPVGVNITETLTGVGPNDVMLGAVAAGRAIQEHDGEDEDEQLNDMTLSPSSIINIDTDPLDHHDDLLLPRAHSPPVESVHSGQLTALSPPPISMKSSGSNYGPHNTSGGSNQSLFSHNSSNPRGPIPAAPSSTGGNNTNSGKKKRPPLPPRWAIGGGAGGANAAGVASSHHAGMNSNYFAPHPSNLPPSGAVVAAGDMVDVVPSHLPPPKQIGPLSHRRVLSTGDASFLSNLTDPDDLIDQDVSSSPLAGAAALGAGPGMPPIVPHSTTNATTAVSGTLQPLPIMNQSSSRKPRGVSWDFGVAQTASHSIESGDGGGGSLVANNHNRYKSEEEAAFDTLGILQPILQDDDRLNVSGGSGGEMGLGDTSNLMQPILMDEKEDDVDISKNKGGPIAFGANNPAFMSSSSPVVIVNQTSLPPAPSPPSPPPNVMPLPKKVVQKQQHTSSKSLLSVKSTATRNLNKAPVKKKEKDHTQFESEAEMAILEALSVYNIHPSIRKSNEREEDIEEEEEMEEETSERDVPTQVISSHRKDISALTTLGFDNHNSPKVKAGRKKGEDVSLFEPSAWSEEYDAAGRIDGTLPEEQVDLNVAAASATGAGARPPLHPLLSVKTESSSVKSDISKPAVKDDDTAIKLKPEEAQANKSTTNIPKDPTATTGLRHRRKNTIAAKGMAEELAHIAALHSINGGSASQGHQRIKTQHTLQTKGGGIDNLFAGVDILTQQEKDGEDDYVDHPSVTAAGGAGGGGGGGNAPHDEETGNGSAGESNDPDGSSHSRRQSRITTRKTHRYNQMDQMRYRLGSWYDDLIKPKLPGFINGAIHAVMFVILPLLIVAFILYYAVGNPIAGGYGDVNEHLGSDYYVHASWSWWILFWVRQFFLLCFVKAGEVISIDILALRTPLFLKTVGSFATLMIVQARGWPYVLTFWSLADFCVLYGNHRFARHWLYWQDWIGLFNESNPAGDFLHSTTYMRILLAVMFVGVVTSFKRLWIATFLGKRSFHHYGPELELILAKMLLVSQVAHLARQLDADVVTSYVSSGYAYTMRGSKALSIPGLTTDSEDENNSPTTPQSKKSLDELSRSGSGQENGFGQSLLDAGIGSKMVSKMSRPRLDSERSTKLKSSKTLMSSSSQLEIMNLLEEWEEPEIMSDSKSKVSIKDILQFRQAVSLMDDTFPFTPAFGPANTRPSCVESSENLYRRLHEGSETTSPLLPFEILSEIAYDQNGNLMRDKVKALIRLFRPDRKGFLTKLDFVSSIDEVYRDFRIFRASLSNSSTIDNSFETMINVVFFIVIILLVLAIVGFKMWEPILSFSSFFFSFSFMFGPASSKYFEGILLIFVRRPYDIGDKIALSDPESDTSGSGSSTWFVEKVSLFTTTVRFATTNEVATYSNGSLARLRVINAKRSPKAIIYVYMKFGSDVPFHMIQVFKAAIENFVKSRPREWAQLNGFRATRVEMELNFIEYVIVATHREMWQNVGPILQSQADLASFSLEVSKRLKLKYHNPPKPVHLSLGRKKTINNEGYDENDIDQVAELFGDAEGGD